MFRTDESANDDRDRNDVNNEEFYARDVFMTALAVSENYVYVGGTTSGSGDDFDGSGAELSFDAFVTQLDATTGSLNRAKRIKSTNPLLYEHVSGLCLDNDENVIATGSTQGLIAQTKFQPSENPNNLDAWVKSLSKSSLNDKWRHQFASKSGQEATGGCVVTENGDAFVVGMTTGKLYYNVAQEGDTFEESTGSYPNELSTALGVSGQVDIFYAKVSNEIK
tara:strand:+ start:95 stop:760 length:666 start_codon:yes stop_codon:yes gene_type:complete